MAQIVVEMSADESKLYRAFVKIMQGQDQMDQGFKKNKKSSDELSHAITSLPGQIAQMAVAWISVEGAINMATAAQQHYQRVIDEAARAHMDLADSQRLALLNLNAPAKNEWFMGEARKIVEDIPGIQGGEKSVYRVLAQALSGARGNPEKALEAARQAFKMSPLNTEHAGAFAYALPQTAERLGPGTTMEQAGGFQLALGKQSLTPTPDKVAEHLIPAWRAMVGKGADPLKAGAFITGLQAAMGDKEGAKTGTAVGQILKALDEVVPKENVYDYDARGRKTLKVKGRGAEDPFAQMEQVRADPKLGAMFQAQEFGRGATKFQVRSMFGADEDRGWKVYQQNLKDFTPREQWASAAKALVEGLNQGATAKLTAGGAQAGNLIEDLAVNTAMGREAAAKQKWSWDATNAQGKRVGIAPLLEQSGIGPLDWQLQRAWYYTSGYSKEEAGTRLLKQRATDLKYGAFGIEGMTAPTTDPAALEAIAKLEEAIEKMTKSSEEVARTNAELLELERHKQNKPPVASPGEKPAAVIP